MTKGPRPITLLHLSDLQFGRHHRFGRLGSAEDASDAAFDSLLFRLRTWPAVPATGPYGSGT